MTKQTCATPHCDDHSGLLMWMKGIAAILSLAACLLSYSVFFQSPSLQINVVKEVARVEKEAQAQSYRLQMAESDIKTLDKRVSVLEAKRR